jgi:hypothetical protein
LIENRFADFDKIGFQANQNRLCFRVAETRVVFQNFRASFGHHQTKKQNSAKFKPFFFAPARVGMIIFLTIPSVCSLVSKLSSVITPIPPVFAPLSPSPTRLWSRAGGHQREIFSVGKHQKRHFPADQTFFYNDFFSRRSTDETFQIADGFNRFGAIAATTTPLPAASPSALTTTDLSASPNEPLCKISIASLNLCAVSYFASGCRAAP